MAQGAPVALKRRHISMPLAARLKPCPSASHFGELRFAGQPSAARQTAGVQALGSLYAPARHASVLSPSVPARIGNWSKLAGASFRQREKATSCRFPTSERGLKVRRSSRVPTTSEEVLREVKTMK